MGQRIARILLGLILTAGCLYYAKLHNDAWIHSNDWAAIAAAAEIEAAEYMQNYYSIASQTESSPSNGNQSTAPTEDTAEIRIDGATAAAPQETPLPIAATEEAGGISAVVENTASAGRADGLPNVDITSWEFILANKDNYIGEYEPQTETLEGQPLDYRIIEPMEAFVAATRETGVPVYLSSGYRDYATQSYLYQRKIGQGYSPEEAATIVNPPGYSEHQTGLACDITDYYRELKDESLENTATYQWMSEHCQDYGFIVRYPRGKGDITGVIYEPWHFRYVGVEAAKYIMANNLCLEEFLDLYR